MNKKKWENDIDFLIEDGWVEKIKTPDCDGCKHLRYEKETNAYYCKLACSYISNSSEKECIRKESEE
jgi:hypothetical protein